MLGNDLTEFRICHAVAGDEISRLNLKTELRCSRFERIGLLINQVREFIGVGGELANRLLLRILALDLALHVFERLNCSRMNVGHVDHMPAEFRFNRADNIALLGVKHRIFKSLRHDAAAEEGQITALFCAARVNGIGLGQFSKLRRISLHFIGKFFSLLAGSFLVIAELDQNMTCAALFRNGPALLILFVKGLEVVQTGLLIAESVRRKDNVLRLDVLGRKKILQVSVVVGFNLFVRNGNLVQVVIRRQNQRANAALFGEDLVELLRKRLGDRIGRTHAGNHRFLSEIVANLHHELLVALALRTQELFITLGRELSVNLKRVSVLNERHSLCFTDGNVVLGHHLIDRSLIHQHAKQVFTSLRRIEQAGVKALTHLLTQAFKLLALGQIKIFRRNRHLAHFDDRVVTLSHAVVRINAGNHKARNNEHHCDDHQPTLVFAECLQHKGSLSKGRFCASLKKAKKRRACQLEMFFCRDADNKKGETSRLAFFKKSLAEWTGLEPATLGVTGRYSNQLNYHSALSRIFGWKQNLTRSNYCRKTVGGVDGTRTRDPRRDRPIF